MPALGLALAIAHAPSLTGLPLPGQVPRRRRALRPAIWAPSDRGRLRLPRERVEAGGLCGPRERARKLGAVGPRTCSSLRPQPPRPAWRPPEPPPPPELTLLGPSPWRPPPYVCTGARSCPLSESSARHSAQAPAADRGFSPGVRMVPHLRKPPSEIRSLSRGGWVRPARGSGDRPKDLRWTEPRGLLLGSLSPRPPTWNKFISTLRKVALGPQESPAGLVLHPGCYSLQPQGRVVPKGAT